MGTNHNGRSGESGNGRVRFEVYPIYTLQHDTRLLTGYDLELYAPKPSRDRAWSPCDESSALAYGQLHRIAERIVPRVNGSTTCEILPYDGAVHACARSHMQPEVRLTIRIGHTKGLDQPASAEQERALKEAQASLWNLGVVS